MSKKYELIEEPNTGLFRIKAIRNFNDISKGFTGGLVQGEHNLSHEGYCWVYKSAKVCGNAKVYGNAQIYHNATIGEEAKVFDDVRIYGDSKVYGNAKVYGFAEVDGKARVYGDARVYENSKVYNSAEVGGKADISRDVKVSGYSEVLGKILRNPLNLKGQFWNITIEDDYLKIGCQYHSFRDWETFSDEQIHQMDGDALRWWKENKDWLFHLIKSSRDY